MSAISRTTCLFLTSFACIALVSCQQSLHAGPKLVVADGKQYLACGGAIWSQGQGDSKNVDTMLYDVIYSDADGKMHHLAGIHNLTISDLPADSQACSPRS